jgi:MFS family permease
MQTELEYQPTKVLVLEVKIDDSIDSKVAEIPTKTDQIQNEETIIVSDFDNQEHNVTSEVETASIIVNNEQMNVKETPLPFRKLLVAVLLLTCDYLSAAALFPYLSQMTCDLLGLDEVKDAKLVGYYAGFIGSSYYVTQLISAPMWGYISDRIGRRPVLLIGITGTIFSCLLFGFSKYFWMAILSRCLYGAFNGNLGVVKTYVRESTDKSNQARAFSIIGGTYAIAIIIGPMIGGFLTRPAQKIPVIFNNWFFVTFPYCLPNLVLASISTIAAVLGYFFLIESKTNQVKEKSEVNSEIIPTVSLLRRFVNKFKNSPIFQSRAPFLACASYALMGMGDIIFSEVFTIWLWTPLQNKGLGLEPYQIGILNMVLGVIIFFTQLWIAPFLNNKMGIKGAFIFTAFLSVPPCFLVVELYRFGTSFRWLVWILLGILYAWRIAFIEICFTSVMMMINNSVDPSGLGSVNGIAQSMVAFTRTIGPALGSSLFAFSISMNISMIFDVHFVFFLCGLLTLLLIPLGMMSPGSINQPK